MLGTAKYRTIKDPADSRDHLYAMSRRPLLTKVDLRSAMPPVVDQGQLGSCTANAIACGLMEYLLLKGAKWQHLSRLFLYWHERFMEGTVNEDAGAIIRDGMKVLQQIGTCPEIDFPYVETTFTKKPSVQSESDAKGFRITSYKRVASLSTAKSALMAGNPIVMGFSVYDSFESDVVANTGVLPISVAGEKVLGGHCVLIVGYDDSTNMFIVRNSWGTGWGDKGYCYMPYSYLSQKIIRDLWIGIV